MERAAACRDGAGGAAPAGRARLPRVLPGRPGLRVDLAGGRSLWPLLAAVAGPPPSREDRLGPAGAALAGLAALRVRPRVLGAPPQLAQPHPPGHVHRPLRAPSPELVHCGEHRQSSTLIFPYLIRGGKPTLLYSWAMAFVFCTYNGYLQSRYLSQYAVYADDWVTQPRFLTGFALWLLGMLINIHSDHILRNLRKPGETGYRIPRGGISRSLKIIQSSEKL
uniref:3-oxo-5-alpha-steroid 4-dehydrogenase 1 isoform X3 n=1 Tax=Ictidomys tridecemlineatus TaxID=43179 RepID=UPI000B5466D2|nr:3-oxo-5-alpha-steroid 4-dehydrogenase 1 isoform X3 [Ictidomys tridecemlineatus]